MKYKVIYQNKLLFPKIIWQKPVHYYKSKVGRILVIAGSRGKMRPAILTCEAVFRSGTGMLTLALPEELKNSFENILPQSLIFALPQTHSGSIARNAIENILEQISSFDLVIIGPGLSTNIETLQFIWNFLNKTNKITIINSDALKAIIYGLDIVAEREGTRKAKDIFKKLGKNFIFVISPDEASKFLFTLKINKGLRKKDYILNHKLEAAKVLNDYLNSLIVITGDKTVIYDGNKFVVDTTTDYNHNNREFDCVLSGIIGSFVVQNKLNTIEAICTAIYLHSLSVKIARKKTNDKKISASNIIKYLSEAIKISEASSENSS